MSSTRTSPRLVDLYKQLLDSRDTKIFVDDVARHYAPATLDRLLVETDAPYLAPIPMRGKPNEPAFVVHTAAKVAALKGIPVDELAQVTTGNFFRLFAKAARPVPDEGTSPR